MPRLISIALFLAMVFASSSGFAASCKSYSTCEEAVKNWCAGNHPRADGDGDGIPCENVCKSKSIVDRIREQIGCS